MKTTIRMMCLVVITVAGISSSAEAQSRYSSGSGGFRARSPVGVFADVLLRQLESRTGQPNRPQDDLFGAAEPPKLDCRVEFDRYGEGRIVETFQGGLADMHGLQGCTILSVNDRPVRSLNDYQHASRADGGRLKLIVRDGNGGPTRVVHVTPAPNDPRFGPPNHQDPFPKMCGTVPKLHRADPFSQPSRPGSRFVTRCGAYLEDLGGDAFVLQYDDGGPRAIFRQVASGSGASHFEYAGRGEPPFDIHALVIESGHLGKVYYGDSEPSFHEAWDGEWNR